MGRNPCTRPGGTDAAARGLTAVRARGHIHRNAAALIDHSGLERARLSRRTRAAARRERIAARRSGRAGAVVLALAVAGRPDGAAIALLAPVEDPVAAERRGHALAIDARGPGGSDRVREATTSVPRIHTVAIVVRFALLVRSLMSSPHTGVIRRRYHVASRRRRLRRWAGAIVLTLARAGGGVGAVALLARGVHGAVAAVPGNLNAGTQSSRRPKILKVSCSN